MAKDRKFTDIGTKNLRGTIPESWACIDCGVNTAPGFNTRGEMQGAFTAISTLANSDGVPQTADEWSKVSQLSRLSGKQREWINMAVACASVV